MFFFLYSSFYLQNIEDRFTYPDQTFHEDGSWVCAEELSVGFQKSFNAWTMSKLSLFRRNHLHEIEYGG